MRGLDVPEGLSEAALFERIKAQFGGLFTSPSNDGLLLAPDGHWYLVGHTKDNGDPSHITYLVDPIDLPREFSELLAQRLKKLDRLKPNARWSVERRIDLRVGPAEVGRARVFHVDRGEGISMVETLNRSRSSRGTYFVGKSGNIFESRPHEGVMFTDNHTVGLGPKTVHASPPTDGQRIFIRYALKAPTRDGSTMSYVDAAGRMIYEEHY